MVKIDIYIDIDAYKQDSYDPDIINIVSRYHLTLGVLSKKSNENFKP